MLPMLSLAVLEQSSECASSMDCSLNGVCSSGKCVCSAPWVGPSCATMRFKPVSYPQGYGMQPNVTSWGGNAIYDSTTGKYHLFVSRIANDCVGLTTWGHNSRIDHAVASNITGPFEFVDVAVGVQAHNSAPVKLPDGTYALFHIGDGVQQRPFTNCSKTDEGLQNSNDGSLIHLSSSLDGPWTAMANNTLGTCNNPAPWVHPNGTLFVLCNNRMPSLMRADQISGPWSVVTNVSSKTPGTEWYEDPFLYTDKHGFHVIYHVYGTKAQPNTTSMNSTCARSAVSAHMFSEDGFTWTLSDIPPYSMQVQLTTGGSVTAATRERPKIFFNDNGQMTHLFTGVAGVSVCGQSMHL